MKANLRWGHTKIAVNVMLKKINKPLSELDDPVKTVYNNDLSSAIKDLFSTLYGLEYFVLNTLEEQEYIYTIRNTWNILRIHGYIKDYGE